MPEKSASDEIKATDCELSPSAVISKSDDAAPVQKESPPSINGAGGINVCLFPKGFKPGKFDVIIGRGKKCHSHFGNKRLKKIIMLRLDEYSRAILQSEKSQILRSIVSQIRNNPSHKGGFVKQDPQTSRWFDVGDNLAREKISKAFRDSLNRRQSRNMNNSEIDIDSSAPFMPSMFQIHSPSQTSENNRMNCFSHYSPAVVSDDSESSDDSYNESPFQMESLYSPNNFFEDQQEDPFIDTPVLSNNAMNFDLSSPLDKGYSADDFEVNFEGINTVEGRCHEFEKTGENIDSNDGIEGLEEIDTQGLENYDDSTTINLHEDIFSMPAFPFAVQNSMLHKSKKLSHPAQSLPYATSREGIKHYFKNVALSSKRRTTSNRLNIYTSRQA